MSFPEISNPPQTNAPAIFNELASALAFPLVYAKAYQTTSGLTWGYYGGRWGGFSVADGTLSLTNTDTNYVVVALATGVISLSTSDTNWNDSTNYARVYKIATGASAVTSVEDHRGGPGGAHGGSGGGASVTIDTDGTLAANSDVVVASQKATKTYVDGKVAGLSWKQAVRAATTANGTLASAFANTQTIDGVTLATGNRILIKNQSSPAENGIYTVNASGAPTRATDADSGAELVNASVYVSEGTTLADTQWTCTTNATITVGSTSLVFAQLATGGGDALTSGTLAQFAATTSAQLRGVLSDETGTGAAVFATAPTLSNAIVGTQSANDNSTKAASTAYVDSAVTASASPWKAAVRAATTANGTLATAFANGQAIDGVTLATGDRILIKNQSTAQDNGIYVVAASGAPTRSTDADSGSELVNATVYVSEGSTLADTQWSCTANAAITIGATALPFAQMGASATLTNFTEAANSGSPNASVPALSLTANNAATDADYVSRPKGAGAFLVKVPDNGSTNGNKRGSSAVDLQLDINSDATKVASGLSSTISGGKGNKASGSYSRVGGGINNLATADNTSIGGGTTNVASISGGTVGGGTSNTASTGADSTVGGGNTNTASAVASTVPGGKRNIADADYSTALGTFAATRGMLGSLAHASGAPASGTEGDRQSRRATLQCDTTSGSGVVATTNAAAASATNQFNLVSGSGLKVRGQAIGKNNATGDCCWIDFTGACKNVSGTVSLSGTPTIGLAGGDASLSTSALTITADNTNKCLQITVSGVAATTIRWALQVDAVEVVA